MLFQKYTARNAAYEAIYKCFHNGAWSAKTLDNILENAGLDNRDNSLATRLFLGVLQNRMFCDYYIDLYSSMPCAKMQLSVQIILEIGVYQLIFTDKIPDRAVVNEAVNLSRDVGCGKASGLINAVLRKISAYKDHLPEIPGMGTPDYLAIRYSHPAWLAEKLVKEHGYAFTEQFFAKNNEPSSIYIQVNTILITEQSFINLLESNGIQFERTLCEGCLKLNGGNITELPGFKEGYFYVQDFAARTAAELGAAEPQMRVLDVCAAPGGKSFTSAVRMRNCGSVLSCDIHEKKLRLISDGAERLKIDIISTQAGDARDFIPEFSEAFDLVIADVPCSGLGVISSKPEIRYKSAADLTGFPTIQRAILDNVCRYVRKGGTLLYSTCTILREENEDVIFPFLDSHEEFKLAPADAYGFSVPEGYYTFWPQTDGTSGFFAAKLKRK